MSVVNPSGASSLPLETIGWREWATLPQLGINRIKAKVDTGARTSALHAFDLEYFEDLAGLMVSFKAHPLQRDTSLKIEAIAPVLEKRQIRNSGGQTQERPVIVTPISFGQQAWEIELTLTNRDVMGFRLLLGREAVRQRFLVDPGGSYLMSEFRRNPVDEVDEPDLP
ncbi:MAG: ATP-dependent zinc protease [Leptolyngbya sp. SIOISBB]|nr:ATP-dependent zinc protease [Leptolyngbya sp. SIOISBB]